MAENFSNLAKQVKVIYYGNDSQPNLIDNKEMIYPLDENSRNTISFSHEWYNPAKELAEWLKTISDTVGNNFISSIASFATDFTKLFGVSLRPLSYFSKAWKGPSSPFSIQLNLSFRFGQMGLYNGLEEVVKPTLGLIQRTLPVLDSTSTDSEGTLNKYLVRGPGPTPLNVLLEVAGEITGFEEFFAGKGAFEKKAKALEQAIEATRTKYQEISDLLYKVLKRYTKTVKGLSKNTIESLKLAMTAALNNNKSEYQESLKYFGGLMEGISYTEMQSRYERELKKFTDEIEKAKNDKKGSQMPRTWELSFAGYTFKYLVCYYSEFSFHPEVDEYGFPIHSLLTLRFQPYIIALANNIGKSDKQPKVGTTDVYGWHTL